MKKFVLPLVFFLMCTIGFSQVLKSATKKGKPLNTVPSDSTKQLRNTKSKNTKASIQQYKILDQNGNVSFVDTSLTIQKEYKFNYLRKDNFGLIPFANLGQTYNRLTREYKESILLPSFGARARHYNYMEVDDIYYYEVPTPLTELFYKSAFQQGQLLDAFFTANLSKRFNFSIAYKGLRSLGNYQHQITSTGNLRFTANFKSKNERYAIKTHITTQDLLNEENGGLNDEDVLNFMSGNDDFLDRSVFDPNFQDAENILVGKRFYLDHEYQLLSPKDSLQSKLLIRNIVNFEDKYFEYRQNSSNELFGDAFNERNIRNRNTLENFQTKISAEYDSPKIGTLKLGLNYNDINYGYDKVTILNAQTIPNRIQDQIVSLDGVYSKRIGLLNFKSKFGVNILGDFKGSYIASNLDYTPSDDISVGAKLTVNSSAPNYNFLLHQSDYLNYNWNKTNDFGNQRYLDLSFRFDSKKYIGLCFDYSSIDNFTFFSKDPEIGLLRPFQLNESISLIKIRMNKEFKVGKFALDNTVLYQKVMDDSQSLNLPEFVIRNTFYYSNHFFKKKALFLQTGIIFNYFSDYFMDGYDPILGEFYTQTTSKIGGFPRLDFFVNFKVRQTRIYFKLEHFNSSFTGYDYFSAPNTPYRDFSIRFGLVWNFFL